MLCSDIFELRGSFFRLTHKNPVDGLPVLCNQCAPMINQANEKTPVQQVHGLIPVVPVRDCPEWAEREAQQQHGSHRVIADDGVTVRCAVSATGYDHRRPTGDWVIEYLHNESDGVHSVRLFAAVRV